MFSSCIAPQEFVLFAAYAGLTCVRLLPHARFSEHRLNTESFYLLFEMLPERGGLLVKSLLVYL